jgi:hypothetical protein
MPRAYEQIRDKFIRMGEPEKDAKKRAAMIYNARRPAGSPPVTRNSEKTAANWKKGSR